MISVIVDGAVQNAEAVRRGLRSLWDVEQVESAARSTIDNSRSKCMRPARSLSRPKTRSSAGWRRPSWTAATHNLYTAGMVVSGRYRCRTSLHFASPDRSIAPKTTSPTPTPANEVLGKDRFGSIRGKVLWTPAAIPELRALFTVAHTDDRPSVNSVSGPDFFARVYGTPSGTLDYRATKTNNYVSDVAYELLPGVRVRSVTSFAATDTDMNRRRPVLFFFVTT